MNHLAYCVGPLLYCPANSNSIVNSIICNAFAPPYSLALCLEDTINDLHVADAVNNLIKILQQLYNYKGSKNFYLPKIFIRVREPKHALI